MKFISCTVLKYKKINAQKGAIVQQIFDIRHSVYTLTFSMYFGKEVVHFLFYNEIVKEEDLLRGTTGLRHKREGLTADKFGGTSKDGKGTQEAAQDGRRRYPEWLPKRQPRALPRSRLFFAHFVERICPFFLTFIFLIVSNTIHKQ